MAAVDIEELAALIVIDCSVAAVTVTATAFDVTPFCEAVMFVEPTPFAFARPLTLIVATAVLEEIHVTELVRFCVLPSVKVAVAVNWSVVPLAIEVLEALIAID